MQPVIFFLGGAGDAAAVQGNDGKGKEKESEGDNMTHTAGRRNTHQHTVFLQRNSRRRRWWVRLALQPRVPVEGAGGRRQGYEDILRWGKACHAKVLQLQVTTLNKFLYSLIKQDKLLKKYAYTPRRTELHWLSAIQLYFCRRASSAHDYYSVPYCHLGNTDFYDFRLPSWFQKDE